MYFMLMDVVFGVWLCCCLIMFGLVMFCISLKNIHVILTIRIDHTIVLVARLLHFCGIILLASSRATSHEGSSKSKHGHGCCDLPFLEDFFFLPTSHGNFRALHHG